MPLSEIQNPIPNIHYPLRIALFGSTGSIGVNTLDVVRRHPERFEITALAANRNIEVLAGQIAEFHPKAVAVADENAAAKLASLAAGRPETGCEVLSGTEGLRELARRDSYDTFIGALTGFAGFAPTLEAILRGKRIALANKETLVVAGELLTALAARTGSEIIPIDSEHSAIYQCLAGESPESIRRIILTASGGPFRTLPKESFPNITLEAALKHPKWKMGRKITIDSATLMNKGLEIIEAKWLFGVPMNNIEVVVHPQSIVHSLVEFVDGSVKAQLGMPDMRLPIQYALAAPERLDQSYDLLDLVSSSPLEFFAPDLDKFPSLALAREAGERGGLYPCILNAANEVAVARFLAGGIGFIEIPQIIRKALDAADTFGAIWQIAPHHSSVPEIAAALQRITECDRTVRESV
ncbi:MAG TPA: 1-deoxy-D-xylulose-5-phosphate reductoisomerase [Candidatus Kapabacteria bacterium]|nr:1-deoxy-D-xylulose-5-phosphate reductoisomerase [Candidatus Kapabacteria bacterium]